mgnify:FL=1|tara:strand:+ start:40 stop:654 length:615 start_codon:yes stop_codon:yes gene_type:complete
METLEGIAFKKPFPHLIINNFYNETELELIWEELKFYTKPDKFFEAKDFGGVVDKTNSHAIILDEIYKKNRKLSNILNVNRKLFTSDALDLFAKIEDCCCIANKSNWDITKVRYYHNDEYYDPHTDKSFQFLAFSYFHKQPKKFSGGELLFPKYDYQYPCNNNSMIIFPGWVEHGVSKVKIDDSDYYSGYGRYSITSFFGSKSN